MQHPDTTRINWESLAFWLAYTAALTVLALELFVWRP